MTREDEITLYRGFKIAVSVFICVYLLKFVFGTNPFYAAIATVACLQGTINDSFKVGIERTIGTIFGGAIGLISIYFISQNSGVIASLVIAFSIMVIVLGCTYLLKKPSSNSIACIVFLAIVTNLEGKDPYFWAAGRIVTTIIGVIIALTCNWILSGEYRKLFDKKKTKLK